MPGDTAARASPSAKLPRWELLRALERVAPRFTLGDALLQLPDYAGTADTILEVMEEADPEIDLMEQLPDSIMRIGHGRSWKGRTLNVILSSRAVGQKAGKGGQNVDFHSGLTRKQAINLINQGNPNKKPKKGTEH